MHQNNQTHPRERPLGLVASHRPGFHRVIYRIYVELIWGYLKVCCGRTVDAGEARLCIDLGSVQLTYHFRDTAEFV